MKDISEEVHAYLRERASIEDDFAKRLSRLAKSNIAKAEIGPMRAVFDVLKDETRAMAMKHTEAAKVLFSEVVEPYEGLADTIKNKRRHVRNQFHIADIRYKLIAKRYLGKRFSTSRKSIAQK